MILELVVILFLIVAFMVSFCNFINKFRNAKEATTTNTQGESFSICKFASFVYFYFLANVAHQITDVCVLNDSSLSGNSDYGSSGVYPDSLPPLTPPPPPYSGKMPPLPPPNKLRTRINSIVCTF